MSTVTLTEAKTHLNLSAATSSAEVQEFIDRAEGAVERRCGPLVSTAKTSRVRGGTCILPLPTWPVLSLTSVTPVGGSALTLSDYIVTTKGIVEHVSGAPFTSRLYDVVYQAGWAATVGAVPPDLKYGVLELIRHLWDTQRGASRTRSDAGTPGAAYMFPHRVEQALVPYAMEF